jgi:hypothetical protein
MTLTPSQMAHRERVLPVERYEGTGLGECDCCGGKDRELTRCFTSCGIETFACEECRS